MPDQYIMEVCFHFSPFFLMTKSWKERELITWYMNSLLIVHYSQNNNQEDGKKKRFTIRALREKLNSLV
jgi:hypothetical protein